MDINVALDGTKKRDLLFYAGDDLSIVLKVYAHDGDTVPIAVTNVRFDAPAGNLPLGTPFTVPYNYIGRSPYRIVGDVAGIVTTLAYGVLETPGGWPSAYYWDYEYGSLPAYPFGVVGKADNITVLDTDQNFTSPISVEGALAELGEFKKEAGDLTNAVAEAQQAATDAEAAAQAAVDTLAGTVKKVDLAAPTGAGEVGQRGENVSNILDQGTRFRGLRAIMDAVEPINRLPQSCLLKKLRSDYLEFAIYSPMTADGTRWNRWYFTNRLNVGNAGSARMTRLSEALLFQSVIQAPAAENQTTGVESQAPSASQATSAATRVGTWTAAATVGGVTDVTYSTAIGDTSTYSITGVSRIGLRSYVNSANGGILGITVKESGVEIPSGNYRVPLNGAVRTVDLKALGTGLYYVPVADVLDPSKTYSVEIAVAATNPAGGRAYDAGLRGYAATAFNAVGRAAGTWFTQVFGAAPTVGDYLSGGKVVYQCANATKINWKFVTSPNSGKVKFKVFDNSGAEIAAGKYVNTAYDCYLGANNLVTVPVAAGLTPGTYYLMVETDTTKNAASTAYRVYDAGVASYNETAGGTLGVDTFDDQGLVGLSVEGTCTLIGTGNLELAISLRKPTDPKTADDFVGGVHGYETNPTSLAFVADDVALDYAGMAVNATAIANTFQWSYSTTLKFKSDGSQAATVAYKAAVSPGGYAPTTTPTYTASAILVHEDYSFMFNVPSTKLGSIALEGIAGGFGKCAVEGSRNFSPTLGNDSVTQIAKQSGGMVVWNRLYAAYGFAVNNEEVNDAAKGALFNPLVSGGFPDSRSILQDRGDSKFKLYNRAFPGNSASGIAIAAGFTSTRRSVYRGFRASGLDVILS